MRIIGYSVFWISGVIMYIFEVYWFFRWWGTIGGVISLCVPPVAVLFPFVYLFKEGFSLFYFGVWAIGLLGIIIASTGSERQ